MSKYKPLYSSIWTDNQFEEYSPNKKLIYIFLLTNQFVEKSGIYKISVRQIAFHTGVINEIINEIINELIKEEKIKYDFERGIIFIKNLFKYQKGIIKNEKIMLLTLKRNYDLISTALWNDFFEIYKDDKTINILINEVINGSLMAHQLYINKNINKDINKNKDKNIEKTKTEPKLDKKFSPPTLQEVKDYCQERNNSVNPEKFFDYYVASNWKDKDGKQVKNWKQKIISWEGRNTTQQESSKFASFSHLKK